MAMKRYATAQTQGPRFAAGRASPPQTWPRHGRRDRQRPPSRDNEAIRGLIIGLPLALALWLMLAMLIWIAF
jgi:hypothetical protein